MRKIICEICGTAYPETSTQCPICGLARPAEARAVHSDVEETSERTYQHVKGGRFSAANVKKRTMGNQGGAFSKPAGAAKPAEDQRVVRSEQAAPASRSDAPAHTNHSNKKKKKSNGNMGLVITIFVLLLAIIAVIAYILIKFFIPREAPEPIETDPIVTEEIIEEIVDVPQDIACMALELDTYEIYLENAGDHVYLVAMPEPFDTTDEVIFESADSSIAMAESDGRVTAVRKGDTVITVTCGSATAECYVYVGVAKPELTLNRQEIDFEKAGDTWLVYNGDIDLSDIIWTTDNAEVATIDEGVITAVGEGTTTVYGDYRGEVVSCVVRCKFVGETTGAEEPITAGETEPTVTEATQPVETEPKGTYKAPYKVKNLTNPDCTTDVSIRVGETFWLELIDSQGKTVKSATWTIEEGDECTVDNGTIKGVKVGDGECVVVIKFDGQTFKCKVRIR